MISILNKGFSIFTCFLGCALVFFAPNAQAQSPKNPPLDTVLVDCVRTPSIDVKKFYPGMENVAQTNNLRRATGIALVAKGEPIYLTGRVVDEDCLPVADAVVEIWHANSYGKYDHANDASDKLLDEHFVGSGNFRTNNLGQFYFLTIFPGTMDEESAPHVNFKVSHQGFETLTTRMYFSEQQANLTDPVLFKNKAYEQELTAKPQFEVRDGRFKTERIEGDMVYHFDITLTGKNQRKEY